MNQIGRYLAFTDVYYLTETVPSTLCDLIHP